MKLMSESIAAEYHCPKLSYSLRSISTSMSETLLCLVDSRAVTNVELVGLCISHLRVSNGKQCDLSLNIATTQRMWLTLTGDRVKYPERVISSKPPDHKFYRWA